MFYTADELISRNTTFYDRLGKLPIDWDSLAYELRWAFCEGNGRPTDPVLYLKCFFVGYVENIERETDLAMRLSDSISIRLFLFGTLSESPPDHSSLSRVRRTMAQRCDFDAVLSKVVDVLESCGLVGGEAVAMDTALVPSRARKSYASDAPLGEKPEACGAPHACQTDVEVEPGILASLEESPIEPNAEPQETAECPNPVVRPSAGEPECESEVPLELEEHFAPPKPAPPKKAREKLVPSSYDLDAHPAGKPGYVPQPSYKIGVAADYRAGVIVAADAYPASMGEGQSMRLLFSDLVRTSGKVPKYAVADAGMDDSNFHATVEFFGATPVTALQKSTSIASGFGKELFFYDQERDLYLCPAGEELKCRSSLDKPRRSYTASPASCKACSLKLWCYGSIKGAKQMDRTFGECSRDRVVAARKDRIHKKLLAYRKAVVEPVFADFKGYGGLAMIWTKGLQCARMKAKLAAIGHNIKILVRHLESGAAGGATPRTAPSPR